MHAPDSINKEGFVFLFLLMGLLFLLLFSAFCILCVLLLSISAKMVSTTEKILEADKNQKFHKL